MTRHFISSLEAKTQALAPGVPVILLTRKDGPEKLAAHAQKAYGLSDEQTRQAAEYLGHEKELMEDPSSGIGGMADACLLKTEDKYRTIFSISIPAISSENSRVWTQ